MTPPTLASLRQTPQPGPARFLRWQPGPHVQYFDDTLAKNPWKALSARSFDLGLARRKQLDGCAVCYSLQAFGTARTKGSLLSFRNLGVDIDLIPARERATLPDHQIDQRKGEYLSGRLLPFPLKPHWLIETRHGFHAVWRVMPIREPERVQAALALNARLVHALGADENAALLTQVLRVPGTLQFKVRGRPFLCRLLLDNAAMIAPYDLEDVRAVLDAWEVFHLPGAETVAKTDARPERRQGRPRPWREGLRGRAALRHIFRSRAWNATARTYMKDKTPPGRRGLSARAGVWSSPPQMIKSWSQAPRAAFAAGPNHAGFHGRRMIFF